MKYAKNVGNALGGISLSVVKTVRNQYSENNKVKEIEYGSKRTRKPEYYLMLCHMEATANNFSKL